MKTSTILMLSCSVACSGGVSGGAASDVAHLDPTSQPGLLGIDSVPSGSITSTMQGLGAKRLRISVDASMTDEAIQAALDEVPHGDRANININYASITEDRHAVSIEQYSADFASRAVHIAQVALTRSDKVGVFQIWNEQDFPPRDGYDPFIPATDYAAVLGDTCQAIKAVAPQVHVITGGFASQRSTRWPYLETVVAQLAEKNQWSCVDAVGFHMYASIDLAPSGDLSSQPTATAFDCSSVEAAYGVSASNCTIANIGHDIDGLQSRTGLPVYIDEWGVQLLHGPLDDRWDGVLAANMTGFFNVVSGLSGVHEASYYAWRDPGALGMSIDSLPKSRVAFRNAAGQ